MLTPELAALTNPVEQSLITEMRADIDSFRYGHNPAYRPELPAHNYAHIYQEVLPTGVRLLERDDKSNTPSNRLLMIAAWALHDVASTVALDPQEGFKTVEQRTAVLVEPILSRYFNPDETKDGQELILATSIDDPCTTLLKRIFRRTDIANVGSKRSEQAILLAKTVSLFHEEFILWAEELAKGRQSPRPLWTPFLDEKSYALSKLTEPDLSLTSERLVKQFDGRLIGIFNLNAERNITLLSAKPSVRDPQRFVSQFGYYLRPLVKDFDTIAAMITN